MENIEFSHMSPEKTKHLFKFICQTIKRRQDRTKAKHDITGQVQTIKDYVSKKGYQKAELKHMLNNLLLGISKAIDKGSKITNYKITLNDGLTIFYKKVEDLENELKTYTDAIEKREDRIRVLEKEIFEESLKRHPHHKKLKELEKRFTELEKLNTFDVRQLSRVRIKIDGIKDDLKAKIAN